MANIVPFNQSQAVQATGVSALTATEQRKILSLYYGNKSVNTLDQAIDLVWAKTNKRPVASSYFDYFFSGQDVQIYINGTETDDTAILPIMDFAFNVQQQKQPLYGFWDYTYSQMLRGTRIVNGQFRIATTTIDALDNALSNVARLRSTLAASGITAPNTKDEDLRDQFWHQNLESVNAPGSKGHNKFASHPPFDFVLIYGVQSASLNGDTISRNQPLLDKYKDDNLPLYTDQNERLVEADPNGAMRFIIEGVELTSRQSEFSPDGTVCSEMYSFIAKDMYNNS